MYKQILCLSLLTTLAACGGGGGGGGGSDQSAPADDVTVKSNGACTEQAITDINKFLDTCEVANRTSNAADIKKVEEACDVLVSTHDKSKECLLHSSITQSSNKYIKECMGFKENETVPTGDVKANLKFFHKFCAIVKTKSMSTNVKDIDTSMAKIKVISSTRASRLADNTYRSNQVAYKGRIGTVADFKNEIVNNQDPYVVVCVLGKAYGNESWSNQSDDTKLSIDQVLENTSGRSKELQIKLSNGLAVGCSRINNASYTVEDVNQALQGIVQIIL